jgi:hypothetical protein
MSYPQQPGGWNDPSWPGDPKSPYGDPPAGQPSPDQPPAGQPPPAGYGAPVYGPPGYPATGYPGYGYPVPSPPTNGLAIGSLVVSVVGAFGLCGYGLGGYLGIVGAIMGHVARRQIRERGESGDGMALAGVIVGWIAFGIAVIATVLIVIFVVWASNQPSTYDSTYGN